MSAREVQMPIAIDDIIIGDNRRPVNSAVVKRLADSIDKLGLRHPITVREKGHRYLLVAGRHRLEACLKLGRDFVPATILSLSNDKARLWEIAENLHRAELTKLERDEQIAEWIRLTENLSGQFAQKGHGHRPEGGVSAAARELGIERTDARRALVTENLTDEAKLAITNAGLDNTRSSYLEVAKAAPENQIATVHALAERRARSVSTNPKDELERAMEWRRSFERVWNQSPRQEDREWARGWIDSPIMDGRYGS